MRVLLNTAKTIYRLTPFQPLRSLYFKLFLWVMGGGTKIAEIEGLTYELYFGELIDAGLYLGEYERDVVAAIESHVRPGWTVLDIGANIGAHTLRFAKCAGPNGKVYAFEPTDYAFKKLVRNISLNSFTNVEAIRLALSNENRAQQTISFRASWLRNGGQVQTTCQVDFRRLDDWCVENGVDQVRLIKLDVDGNEFSVLDGARRLLSEAKPLLFMEVALYHFADPTQNPVSLLEAYGYRFWHAKSGRRYRDMGEIRDRLTHGDGKGLDSVNVIAGVIGTPLVLNNNDVNAR